MKKLLAFLLAIAMLGLVSCESDKPENPKDTAISEPVEEIPTEPVFMEYNQSDFAQINVAVNRQDGEPIIPVNTYDLKKLADVKELSPCKLPENRENIIPFAYEFKDYNTEEFDEESFNNFCDNPSEAFFYGFAVCGDKIAAYADYDEICSYNHCYKILEYDVKTEEVRELYGYSSADEGENIWDMNYIDGELYVIREREKTAQKEICRLTNGKLEALFTADDIPNKTSRTYYTAFLHEDKGRLIIVRGGSYTNSNDEEFSEYVFAEYDTETGELSEIFRTEDRSDSKIWNNFPVFMNGDAIITTELDENGKTCIVSDNFRINTGIRGLQLKSVNGSRIAAWISDDSQTILYTYDLDKKECYISNINGASNIYSVGENVVLIYGAYSSRAYSLLVPDLGASFNIYKSNNGVYQGYDGGRLWFADASLSWSIGTDNDGNKDFFAKSGDAAGNIIIIGE